MLRPPSADGGGQFGGALDVRKPFLGLLRQIACAGPLLRIGVERALKIRTESYTPPLPLSVTKVALARAPYPVAQPPPRARALAHDAEEGFAHREGPPERALAVLRSRA